MMTPRESSGDPVFSVVTPTYNRRHTLAAVYQGLLAQAFKDFEWIIIDDGSTDETEELVRRWSPPFRVRYHYQRNAGKGAAVNRGIELARGDFLVVLGSDDVPLPAALETFHREFEAANADVGIVGALTVRGDGEIIGSRISSGTRETTVLDAYRHGMRGDKWFAFRTAVARAYPYPVYEGEKHVPPATVYNRMSRAGIRARFIDTPLLLHEYLEDGITRQITGVKSRNPKGYLNYYVENLVSSDAQLSIFDMKHAANLFSTIVLAARRPLTSTVLLVMALPLGLMKGLLDRWSARG